MISHGQTGLNVAFDDLPTQMGYDSDDPMSEVRLAGRYGG